MPGWGSSFGMSASVTAAAGVNFELSTATGEGFDSGMARLQKLEKSGPVPAREGKGRSENPRERMSAPTGGDLKLTSAGPLPGCHSPPGRQAVHSRLG